MNNEKHKVKLTSEGSCGHAECNYYYTDEQIDELTRALLDWDEGDTEEFDSTWGKDLAKAYDKKPDELWKEFIQEYPDPEDREYQKPSDAWWDSYGAGEPECYHSLYVDGDFIEYWDDGLPCFVHENKKIMKENNENANDNVKLNSLKERFNRDMTRSGVNFENVEAVVVFMPNETYKNLGPVWVLRWGKNNGSPSFTAYEDAAFRSYYYFGKTNANSWQNAGYNLIMDVSQIKTMISKYANVDNLTVVYKKN